MVPFCTLHLVCGINPLCLSIYLIPVSVSQLIFSCSISRSVALHTGTVCQKQSTPPLIQNHSFDLCFKWLLFSSYLTVLSFIYWTLVMPVWHVSFVHKIPLHVICNVICHTVFLSSPIIPLFFTPSLKTTGFTNTSHNTSSLPHYCLQSTE